MNFNRGSSIAQRTEHFRARVLQDALNEALATCWLRRAEALEQARPRSGDYHGAATRDELNARWTYLTEAAQACRNRATVSLRHVGIDDDIFQALADTEKEAAA